MPRIQNMKQLIKQILRFGVVGVLAFIIDFGLFNVLVYVSLNALVASSISFTVSLVFNYFASMKFVFVRRSDMARWMEMLIFVISSLIGLLINILIIWIFVSVIIPPSLETTNHTQYQIFVDIGKLASAGVVMIWNFIIRKWLLEPPRTGTKNNKRSISRSLGLWSLNHSKKAWTNISHSSMKYQNAIFS